MLNIYFEHKDEWVVGERTKARGSGFLNDERLSTTDLVSRIDNIGDISDVIDLIDEFNGFFSLIYQHKNKTLIAADHINSTPLYYGKSQRELYISDSSQWIDDQCSDSYDQYTATEYLHTGFVTGTDTISCGTSQVQAGEYVIFDTSTGNILNQDRYHQSRFGYGSTTPTSERFDSIFENITRRLIEFADGRPICLALSGGSDSRLIAMMLNRLGYENVYTYTHDLPSGSRNDIPIAKSISEELGFEHTTITVTHDDFREFYESSRWDDFCEAVDYFSSVPNIHETVVLEQLKSTIDFSAKPIDVRGHLPIPHGRDAFFPTALEEKRFFTQTGFLDEVWNGHYIRWNADKDSKKFENYLRARGMNCLPMELFKNSSVEPSPKIAAALSQWYWQERAAKYLVFDHEYDFVGFDRWFPLWDKEYIAFLQSLTLSSLIERRAQTEFVEQLSGEMLGWPTPQLNPSTASSDTLLSASKAKFWQTAKSVLDGLPNSVEYRLKAVGRDILWNFTRGYHSDPRYGLVSEEEFAQFDLDRNDAETFYYLLMYRDGLFTLPTDTELDRAVPDTTR